MGKLQRRALFLLSHGGFFTLIAARFLRTDLEFITR